MTQTAQDETDAKRCAGFRRTRLYFALTLDPLHIGTGEFQLGRVDNQIVRDAGTGLPKIPGTSLAGVARANTALCEKRYRHTLNDREYWCAGKGGDEGELHCAQSDCPVCMSFGFSRGNYSFQGLVHFSEARLVFYPVASLCGPIWLTSPYALAAAGIKTGVEPEEFERALEPEAFIWAAGTFADNYRKLNAGWLYFPRLTTKPAGLGEPGDWTLESNNRLKEVKEIRGILPRVVVVSDDYFPLIVEDQLEIRTNVSIDPATGAAAKGALFTYEAVSRGALFAFYLTAMDPKLFRNPFPQAKEKEIPLDAGRVLGVVERGLSVVEWLGMGGSNTRGLGRTRIFKVAEVQ
jgi:CRISPR-associated protein Cmr4